MECLNCHKEIPENSRFCPFCKFEQYIICSKCGNKYPSNYQFCNNCGTDKACKDMTVIETVVKKESKQVNKSINAQNKQIIEIQEKDKVAEEERMIRNTAEYIDALLYLNKMIDEDRKSTTIKWLRLTIIPATLGVLCLIFGIRDGFDQEMSAIFGISGAITFVFWLYIYPIILLCIARSTRNREKLINQYVSKNPIPSHLQSILPSALNYIRTIGNMSRKRLKKRFPDILLNSYKFVHFYASED